VRAFPGTFDFLLSQPSPKQFFRPMIVPIKARLFPRYFCRKKSSVLLLANMKE